MDNQSTVYRSVGMNVAGIEFVLQVKRCVAEESRRVRRYVHPLSCERIEVECHLWLVCDENIAFISDLCGDIVRREQWKGN